MGVGGSPISITLHSFLKKQKKEGESFEDCVVRLLKSYPVSDWKLEKKTTIQLSDDAKAFIKEYRITDGESIENILTRLLMKK